MANWEQVARRAAQAHGIDPDIFARQIRAESGFNPNARSPAGATGIAQIMPATAKGWGVDPNDPNASLNAAARAMSKYLKSYSGDWSKALAAYNAGVGAVQKYGGVPPYKETKNYIAKILNGQSPKQSVPTGGGASPSGGAASMKPAYLDPQTQSLEFILQGSPFEGMASAAYTQRGGAGSAPEASATPTGGMGTGKGVPKRKKGETGQQYLDRVLIGKFGLRHDAGNSQTTGGKHATNSDHYVNKATDFGDAKNDPTVLSEAVAWVSANAEALGAKPPIWQSEGHYDHAHFATHRSKRTPKR